MNITEQAQQLFPNNLTMQQRWIEARKKADTLTPKYGKMLPLYEWVARVDPFVKRVDR